MRSLLNRPDKQLGWQSVQWAIRLEPRLWAVYTKRAQWHQDDENKRLAEGKLAPRLRLVDRHFEKAHQEFESTPALFFTLLSDED